MTRKFYCESCKDIVHYNLAPFTNSVLLITCYLDNWVFPFENAYFVQNSFLLSTPLLFQRMTRDVCTSAKYWKHRSSHLFLSMFFPLSNQFLVLMLREEFAISPQQGHLGKALALSCLYSSLCIIIKLQRHIFF